MKRVYVDVSTTNEKQDGTKEFPYKTIPENIYDKSGVSIYIYDSKIDKSSLWDYNSDNKNK